MRRRAHNAQTLAARSLSLSSSHPHRATARPAPPARPAHLDHGQLVLQLHAQHVDLGVHHLDRLLDLGL